MWPAALSAESSHRGEGRWPSRVAAVVTKAQVGPQEGNQGDVQPTEHTEGLCLLGLRADPLLGVGGCGADLGGSSSTQGSVPVAPRDRPTRLRPWVSLGVPSTGAFLTHQSPTWKRSKRELILPGWRSPRFVLPGAEVLLSTCCMQASVSGLRPREDWESGVSQPQRSCGALIHWPLSSAPRESLHGTWGSLPVGLAVDSCFCVLPSRGGSLGPAGTARGSGDRWAREDSPRQPSVRAGALVGRSLPDTAVSRARICRGVKW